MLLYKNGAADGRTVAERFAAALGYVDRVDALVGFFFFSGIKALEASLREHPEVRMRVLVGMGAEVRMRQVVEVPQAPNLSREGQAALALEHLRRVLGSGALERRGFLERVGFFVELLTAGRLEVRQTAEPNHAKLWLFHNAPAHREALGEGRFIVGSTNFSRPALASETQAELDVELSDWGYGEAQDYFDALWETAVPLDNEALAAALAQRRPLTPFEAYALALDTVVRDAPENASLNQRITGALKRAGYESLTYQRDAVVQACAMLERFHGVLLADVVGLGKSVIASVIASVAPSGRYGLILCPPGLVENWKEYRQAFGLGGWRVFSSGNLEAVKEELRADPGYGMVIVDEAHRFRNAKSAHYADLHAICSGRDVLLLTATPLNNRVDDLAAMLGLFMPSANNPLVYGGDLEAWFGDLGKKLAACQEALREARHLGEGRLACEAFPKKLLENAGMDALEALTLRGRVATEAALNALHARHHGRLRAVLEQVTIRRNRLDLLHDPDYSKDLPALATVHDPERRYFALSDAQDAFYDRVVTEAFGGLAPRWQGPLYQPERYATRRPKGADATQGNIHSNIRRMLVRRFESSFAAFRRSLEHMLAAYRLAQDFIARTGTFLYARKEMEDLLAEDDPEAFDERLATLFEELATRTTLDNKAYVYDLRAEDFKREAFLNDIAGDVKLIEGLLKEMETLGLNAEDPKAEALIAACKESLAGTRFRDGDPSAPKRKVLIFSEFVDTVEALGARLRAAFPGRVCVVRGLSKEMRQILRTNFDASCPTAEQRDDFDLLLGTDKLSEGLNLNRAGVVVNYDIPWNPTRVLQRLGRINRIGRRVFRDLFTVNFFPTRRGEDLVGNERIAKEKLYAIHKTLGEDVKLFEPGEQPSAADLWERLNAPHEQTTPIVKWRRIHAALTAAHPGLFARVRAAAPNAKSAFGADETGALWQLRAQGHRLQAFMGTAEGTIQPVSTLELLEALKCPPETPLAEAALHAKPFWDALNALADYRPPSMSLRQGVTAKALHVLDLLEREAPETVADVATLREALHLGRLAHHQVARLAELPQTADDLAIAKKNLAAVIELLRLAGSRPASPTETLPIVSVWKAHPLPR